MLGLGRLGFVQPSTFWLGMHQPAAFQASRSIDCSLLLRKNRESEKETPLLSSPQSHFGACVSVSVTVAKCISLQFVTVSFHTSAKAKKNPTTRQFTRQFLKDAARRVRVLACSFTRLRQKDCNFALGHTHTLSLSYLFVPLSLSLLLSSKRSPHSSSSILYRIYPFTIAALLDHSFARHSLLYIPPFEYPIATFTSCQLSTCLEHLQDD